MREGYVTSVHADGPDTPICDEESWALANQNKIRIDTLQEKMLNMEAAHEYLNSSDTWFGFRVPIGNAKSEGEPVGNLFRLRHMQEIFKIGGYMVKNDHSRKKLHPSDHRYYEDGSPVDFTGAHGHYQWGWGVGLWYAAWSDNDYKYEAFDTRRIPGVPCVYIPVGSRSCSGYAALDRTNNILCGYINKTAQFRGGNNSNWDDTYRSLIGKPVTSIGMPTLATYARANGNMWFTSERVMLYITGALIRVYFHNRNIQAARNTQLTADGLPQGGLGMGADCPSDWANRGYNPYLDLDLDIEMGDYTGLLSTKIKDENDEDITINNIPCFMGLKNFYKYLWTMTEDDLLICQADGTQAFYVEEMIDGTTFDVSGAGNHLLIGKTPTRASAGWSYIKDISTDYLSGMPTEVGATGSTYFADGYYNPVGEAGLVRGAIRLGDADSGGNAGSCVLYGNLAPSDATAFWGAVLCEFAAPFSTKLTTVA